MVQLNVKYVSMVECSVRRAVFCEAVSWDVLAALLDVRLGLMHNY